MADPLLRNSHTPLWSAATVSNIVHQSAYSGTHRVKTNGGKDVIEQAVPAILSSKVQQRAAAVLKENRRYPNRKNARKYLLRGLVKCAACGAAARQAPRKGHLCGQTPR